MRKINEFYEFDLKLLNDSLKTLKRVYDFYYGVPGMSHKLKRLETIISKLESFIESENAE